MVKKILRYSLILAAVFSVFFLADSLNFFEWAENKSYDSRINVTAPFVPTSDRIGLVVIDQESLNWARKEKGWGWPWPRAAYGEILDYFARANAASVAFDIIYSEPSLMGQEDDLKFAEALKRNGRGILAQHVTQDVYGERLETGPIDILAESCAMVADVTGESDKDGIIRRGHAKAQDSYTLSSASLKIAGELPDSFKNSTKGGINIRYLENLDRYVPYKASAILKTESFLKKAETEGQSLTEEELENLDLLPPEQFEDNFIFTGVYAPGLFDICATPVNASYQGVGVHISLLETMLLDNWLVELSQAATLVIIILAGFMGMIFGSSILSKKIHSLLLRSIILLAIAMCYTVFSYYIFLNGIIIPVVTPLSILFLTYIAFVFEDYITEGREKIFLTQAFRQYLSPAVIDQLMNNHSSLKLGGEEKEITAYFCDIEGFTSISESLSPEIITIALNRYLTAMTDVIIEHGGTLDKYFGDAIVAFWNAPVTQENHAKLAVEAAIAAQAKLKEMQQELFELTGKVFKQRIGLNTGKVIVGNMGSTRRFNYSMLGDTVNLASRLEGLNKQFGTYTMCSQSTMEAAARNGSDYYFQEVGNVAVAGKQSSVKVFTPMPKETASSPEKAAQIETFSKAYELFKKGSFDEARILFQNNNHDPLSQKYAEKCRQLIENPPTYPWDGIIRATKK